MLVLLGEVDRGLMGFIELMVGTVIEVDQKRAIIELRVAN